MPFDRSTKLQSSPMRAVDDCDDDVEEDEDCDVQDEAEDCN